MEACKHSDGLQVVTERSLKSSPTWTQKEAVVYDGPAKGNHSFLSDPQIGQRPKAGRGRTICDITQKRFWLVFVSVMLLVVGAGVGGAIGGSMKRSSGRPSLAEDRPPSTRPDGNFPDSNFSPFIDDESSLASVAWNETGGMTQYRLYFQDRNDIVKELAWNSTKRAWYLSNGAIGRAKRGSSLAAAVDQRLGTPTLHVFALNDSSNVIERSNDGSGWIDGTIADGPSAASGVSSLAAIWHQHEFCLECTETLLVVYQDSNQRLVLANHTWDLPVAQGGGWRWDVMGLQPTMGSGLAMSSMREPGEPTALQLYYQAANGQLREAAWNSSATDADAAVKGRWYQIGDDTLPVLSLNASISAFTHVDTSNGQRDVVEIVSSGPGGLATTWRTGVEGGEWGPIQNPAVLSAVELYSKLASNADGHAFAMQDRKIKEFRAAMTAEPDSEPVWIEVGEVPLS
ncbi:MAG: hypothetical protein M1817_004468 [Caeruleum heppii]|nr:MAG: hypothetical protein M1817_004468 [Caeruleum heppii]